MNKLTVVTVCYNAVDDIEKTIQSVLGQTYKNFEYIIIDGKSTDGTVELINKYNEKISSFISEPDGGIYDAMNKGIDLANSEWIFFINAGDVFAADTVLEQIFSNQNYDADVLYGNAIERDENKIIRKEAKIISLTLPPDYRHGASFVRTDVHKKYKFDLSKADLLKYSLDYECIFSLFKAKSKFLKLSIDIIIYEKEGMSNHPIRNKWYRSLIIHDCKKTPLLYVSFIKSLFISCLKKFRFMKRITLSLYWLFTDYVMNHIFAHVPFWLLRKVYLLICGARIGKRTQVDMNCVILDPFKLKLGAHSHINRNCLLDARGGIYIGDCVSISQRVVLVTGSHDLRSSDFTFVRETIEIEDYVWIGINATILGGVKIGKGAVVCAGAVVTKSIAPYSIVAGVPARKIGDRPCDLSYLPLGEEYFWPMFT